MTAPVEREVKLDAEPTFVLPDLDGVVEGVKPGPVDVATLDATYYDRPDLRLARSGITLRYRVEGEDKGLWTLKLPEGNGVGPALSRTELEVPGEPGTIPETLSDLVQVHLRGAPLVPVAELRTVRRRLALLDGEGREVAEVDDDEVTALQGSRTTSAFREIEVELRDGAPMRLLPAVVRVLKGAGADVAKGRPLPKAVRVMGDAALAPPEVEARPLPADPVVGDVVRAAIAAGVERLMRHDPGVRIGADPEAVHQARVATRRLRSDLRTFRTVLDQSWVTATRDELRWVAGALGGVRDGDVLMDRLRRRVVQLPVQDGPAAQGLLAKLDAELGQARDALLGVLRSRRYLTLVETLVQGANDPPFTEAAALPAGAALPRQVRKPWRRLARAVDELPSQPGDVELHHVRVLAKRARYAAEAVAPVAGRAATRFAEAVAGLQGVLGDLHDAVVAQEWLRTAAGRHPTRALVAGEILAQERADAASLRDRWRAVWEKAAGKKLRSWMR